MATLVVVLTGGARGRYWDVAERPMRLMERVNKPNGLYPTFINPRSATWTTGKVAFGALGDSFYEYLIKQWLQARPASPSSRDDKNTLSSGDGRGLVSLCPMLGAV